jgi:hypothetical protein
MKRVISIFLIVSMLFMLAACGGNAKVEELPVAADDPLAEDREFLEGIGEVTVENGILTVAGQRLICTSYLAGAVGIDGYICSLCFEDGEVSM